MNVSTVVGRVAALAFVLVACGGNNPGAPPTVQNGILVYSTNGARQTIPCDFRPVQLSGNHTALHMTGGCRFVRVAGEHNDISVEVIPGGTIEITGEHNDVTWLQMGRGPAPALVDRGSSNTFHRGREG